MDDSWAYPTSRGRAHVTDGKLHVEYSLPSMFRGGLREKWTRAEWKHRALFLLSMYGIASLFVRLVPAVQALLGPEQPSMLQWLSLAAVGVLGLVVAWQLSRSKTLPLDSIEDLQRDSTTLRITHVEDGEQATYELTFPTETDVNDAVEALRLKGVSANRDVNAVRDESASGYESVRTRVSETNE
ncbi:hypothetical protein [Halorussus halophilus]|uniref:hypothetical protein n=1 Tax=Halorussus halophilus TaxID=2650975 RepID=UPI0013018AC3|nr:hypothetical protein [Halorussus halophilus]